MKVAPKNNSKSAANINLNQERHSKRTRRYTEKNNSHHRNMLNNRSFLENCMYIKNCEEIYEF
jgi:hypothetical protein